MWISIKSGEQIIMADIKVPSNTNNSTNTRLDSQIEIQKMPCESGHGNYPIPYIEITNEDNTTQHIFIYGEGYGYVSKYFLEWTDVAKKKFHKSKVDFYNYTNWVDAKKSAYKRMLHWREVLYESGFSGEDVDINDPYGYREVDWEDAYRKGRD